MANKFVSFGPSICRGIRHFRGLKVPKWDALSRYTAFRYMSSIVDRKFSSPFHKSEQIDQSRRSTRKANAPVNVKPQGGAGAGRPRGF